MTKYPPYPISPLPTLSAACSVCLKTDPLFSLPLSHTPSSLTQLYVISEELLFDANGEATASIVTANVSFAQTCRSPGGTYLAATLTATTVLATGETSFDLMSSGNQGVGRGDRGDGGAGGTKPLFRLATSSGSLLTWRWGGGGEGHCTALHACSNLMQ